MSSTVADHGGSGTQITAIHSDIIQSHILNRLDASTLASTTCASTQLYSLCRDDHLWKQICNSNWPSTIDPRVLDIISTFPSGHCSFYSDSFSSVVRRHGQYRYSTNKINYQRRLSAASELISAVDIYCDEKLIYSKVMITQTLSGWFRCSSFRLDLLEPTEIVPTPLTFDGEDGNCMEIASDRLRVSWIFIDPVKKRAVNVASRKAVEARRHWLTDDVQLRFSTVMADGCGELVQCGVMVTCGGKEGGELHVREVNMQVEDMEGKIRCGMDGLVILQEAMEGERCKSSSRMEKDDYEMFLRMKLQRRERKQRRERRLDIAFIATGVSIFFAIWVLFFSR